MNTLLQGHFIKPENPSSSPAQQEVAKAIFFALWHTKHAYWDTALFILMNRFIEKIILSKLDGSHLKQINHFERTPLIIFDDFGLQPLDQHSKLALLQILEDRYAKKSVIMTSQLPVAKMV